MDQDDTEVGLRPAPAPDTDRDQRAVMLADTDEWGDTDELLAEGTIDTTTPQMFEDTGVVIIDRPPEPAKSDKLVVTFRDRPLVRFKEATQPPAAHARASTSAEWPPPPREPAPQAPRHAAIIPIVRRPETKN